MDEHPNCEIDHDRSRLFLKVVSTFTSRPIKSSLRSAITEAGITHGLGFVEYGQMSEYMLGPAPHSPHILGTIILLRVEDWLREKLKSAIGELTLGRGQDELRHELGKRTDDFIKQLEALSSHGKQVWFLACPSTGWISEQHKLGVVCQLYSNVLVARVQALPQTTVLNWPTSLSQFDDHSADRLGQIPFSQRAFDQLGRFVGTQVARTLVRQEPAAKISAARACSELGAYLVGLRVHIELKPPAPGDRVHIDRILRTAATFSLSGEDPGITETEVDALVESDTCMLICVSDRLSKHGISGLVSFRPAEDSLVVEKMALSCTVLGKQVEYAVLSALAAIAVERHITTLIFEYRESARNEATLRFLESVADAVPGNRYLVPVNSAEARIKAVAAEAGAWTLRLERKTGILVGPST